MNRNLVKLIGIAATLIGVGATLLTDWVNDKKTDEKIEEKIRIVLARKIKEES